MQIRQSIRNQIGREEKMQKFNNFEVEILLGWQLAKNNKINLIYDIFSCTKGVKQKV